LLCAILGGRAGAHYIVYEDETLVVSLPRYVTRWGHIMVTPRAHVVRVADVSRATWLAMSEATHRAAGVVEALHAPHRVYVVSTGTRGEGLVHTCEHVHMHVVPVYEPADKPSDVLTWEHGVFVAEPEEWDALLVRAREAFHAG
jgi:diadenosine tetraphosphate (Ap4A) HIT family hydrolase